MNYTKFSWLKILLWSLVLLFAAFIILVITAPHYDAKNRGFAFCTKNLADDLQQCEKNHFCIAESILQSNWCDLKVIGQSFQDWIKGKHPAPWSGYIFKADTASLLYFDDEIKEYLEEYPNTKEDMKQLKKLRKDMENAQYKKDTIEKIIR